jgi:cell division protease FtsH
MVKLWGMSEVMGPMAYGEEEGEVFLGRQVTKHKHISDDTFTLIDSEIRKIIDKNYKVATKLLTENIDILRSMAKALVEFETIDKDQIDDLMNRKEMRDPAVIIDSDVVSTELGSGVEDQSDDSNNKPKQNPLGGGTEQIA